MVVFAGDGGILLNVQELATALQHRIPVVVMVINNGKYGNVKLIQQKNYGSRHIATELQNPDFVVLARSFGMQAEQVSDEASLRGALDRMLASGEPGLIELPVGDFPDVWELIERPPSQG